MEDFWLIVVTEGNGNETGIHGSRCNLTPADAYFGRDKAIIERRKIITKQTIEKRRPAHQRHAAQGQSEVSVRSAGDDFCQSLSLRFQSLRSGCTQMSFLARAHSFFLS